MDCQDRIATRYRRSIALCVALRRPTMADEAIRCGRLGSNHDRGHVSAVADQATDRRLVPQHGLPWPCRPIFRHGHISPDPILRHGRVNAPWFLVVSEFV